MAKVPDSEPFEYQALDAPQETGFQDRELFPGQRMKRMCDRNRNPKARCTDVLLPGIVPIVKHRGAQTAVRLVIEPIFETNFLNCSHGFRPGRKPHDAIDVIQRSITFEGYREAVDADWKALFRHDPSRSIAGVGRSANLRPPRDELDQGVAALWRDGS